MHEYYSTSYYSTLPLYFKQKVKSLSMTVQIVEDGSSHEQITMVDPQLGEHVVNLEQVGWLRCQHSNHPHLRIQVSGVSREMDSPV